MISVVSFKKGGSTLMKNKNEVLLSGREFTQKELELIKETVNMFSNLSRTELAYTICEHLEWYTATGNYKFRSAFNLLEKLHKQGKIKLPAKQKSKKYKKRAPKITSRTDKPGLEITGTVSDYSPIKAVKLTNKKRKKLWNEYIERYHNLGYKFPFGARQRYFIIGKVDGKDRVLGCLMFAAAAWALKERDKWIGWEEKHRSKYLNGIVNNTRFLIFPWVKVKNLASKSLSLTIKRICSDWKERYNYKPVLLETFVDEKEYTGSCYKAANWIYLGKTKGRGRQDRNREYLSSSKLIFV